MKKLFFGIIAAAVVITGIFTFAGCEKEEENVRQDFVLHKNILKTADETEFPYEIFNLTGLNLDSLINNPGCDNIFYENEFIVTDNDGYSCYGIIITADTERLREWAVEEEAQGKQVMIFPVYVNGEFKFAIGISVRRHDNDEDENE